MIMPFHALDPRPIIIFFNVTQENNFLKINTRLDHFNEKTFHLYFKTVQLLNLFQMGDKMDPSLF